MKGFWGNDRRVLLLWLLLGALGCSEGETIPLVPPGTVCERPLDPTWYDLTNVSAGRTPRDVVWPAGQMPIVVGDEGLLLECESYGSWSSVDSGVSSDLQVVAVTADGVVVAAGEDGAVTVRINGNWEAQDLGIPTNWRDVRTQGREVWLAGEGGALAVGIPGESWSRVEFPDTTDLLGVCVFADSVFVAGTNGLLKVRAGGQWLDQGLPEWENEGVNSVVRIPDGRLAVLKGSNLIIRELTGWQSVEDFYCSCYENHLKIIDGLLWGAGEHVWNVDLSTSPRESQVIATPQSIKGFAVGPAGRVFSGGLLGLLTWSLPLGDGIFENRADPAGRISARKLIRFKDGTVVVPASLELFRVTSSGVKRVEGLSREVLNYLNSGVVLCGHSLADFYVANGLGVSLVHCLAGEVVSQEDIPGSGGSIQGMVMDDMGQICLNNSDGLWFFSQGEWELYPKDERLELYLTSFQTFVGLSRDFALYRTTTGWIPIDLEDRAIQVMENESGTLEFMSRYFDWFWWEKGTGANGSRQLDPIPGCENTRSEYSSDTLLGTLFATYGHSLVLKMPADVARGDWELVAGPCKRQIEIMQVLEDGNLVAVDHSKNYIMIHPSSGF